MLFKTIQITLFSTLALAAPLASNNLLFGRAGHGVSAIDLIRASVPKAVDNCQGTPIPAECATAEQAAANIQAVAVAYNGELKFGEVAATTALMAFETGSFLYNIHHIPNPVAGQGTRNMQSAEFNLQYAQSIPDLKDSLAKITTATTTAGLTDDQKNQILNLVADEKYTWGSAAWFLKTKCTQAVRDGLNAGSDDAWIQYITVCVDTSNPPERMAFWTAAKTAVGL